jgi:YegS/Rv2252/BmrU family lipid kinase
MANKKLLLIVNPNAGKMRAGSTLLDIVGEFSMCKFHKFRKYDVTVFPTAKKYDAMNKVIESAGDYDLVVCYGGDGTISETASGVARIENPPPFSFIPSGTANDIAATLLMPTDIPQAVRKIIAGKNRPIDIGKFNNNKHFLYVAAFGLFTSVSYTVPQDAKKIFGHFSYVVEGAKQIIDIPSYRMTVQFNNKTIKGDFVVGLVTNSTSVAGLFKIDRSKVKLDDGEFELILIKNPKNPVLLSQILMELSVQKYDPEYVIFERVSSVNFRCETDVAWCLDGECGGTYKKANITNLHKRGIIRI